ncbi:MAG: DNA repair protein RecO C-terminal domain-containing protein [Bacteroidaceae bacterium]|nr:DNA repair protein RecO C-terminal domain-containing protein [Bacteroidaceae bacterium]
MQENVRCLVLRTVKYGDNSIIVDTFTESRGRMSFVTPFARGRRSSAAFWAQLSQVEFQADIRPQGKLAKPQDVRFYYNYMDLPFSPLKSSIAMFVGEFLCAALRSEGENRPLYKYVETSLRWLDVADTKNQSSGVANFHLVFLMHLSRFLGIYPNLENCHCPYFDLVAGEYCERQPTHSHFLRDEEARVLPLLFRMDYGTMHVYRFNRQQRQRCLEVLLDYYRIHIPQFPQLKSLEVLAELFG